MRVGPADALKFFGLNNLSIESEVRRISSLYSVDLGHSAQSRDNVDDQYYPQFSERLRAEADAMAKHFAVFYCLENSVRDLISDSLTEVHGVNWWASAVPAAVQENALKNQRRELSSGITPRSDKLIDYTNFGELGEIIKVNWDIFGASLNDLGAVQKIFHNLNTLRAPIAHCKSLAEDEVVRLHLSLRDWFRQLS